MTPDEMLETLLDPAFEDDGSLVNDLLSEVGRGYPVENLRRLNLPHSGGDLAFLASELGKKARPILDDVVTLLEVGARECAGT